MNAIRKTLRPPYMPTDTPNYATPAWASAMTWALGQDQFRHRFFRDNNLAPDASLETAVAHFGSDDAMMAAWCAWFNENVWGPWE